LMQSKRTGSR